MPGRTVAPSPGSGTSVAVSITGLLLTGVLITACAGANGGASGAARATSPSDTPAATSSGPPSSSPPASSSSTPSSAPSRAASGLPERCHTAQLAGRVRSLGAAAGNRYAALILTNTSDDACRTYGYVGLQLARAGGTDVPTRVIREPNPAPHRVVLRPGESAFSRIHWTVVPGEGEPSTEQCAPAPSRLLVIPPDERTQTAAAWPGGPVCQRGRIFVTALSEGTG